MITVNLRLHIYSVFCFLGLTLNSCSRLVEVDPPITSTNGENVFNDESTAIAVLTGIYTNMSNSPVATLDGWLTNICLISGLTGDELQPVNAGDITFGQYFNNDIQAASLSTWSNIYRMVFIANSAIENLPQSSINPKLKNQLIGEAKFVRALCNFYLVNMYGPIPLALSTDYQINRVLPRSSEEQVYNQMIIDLKDAQLSMSDSFVGKDGVSVTSERVRPSKWAATALLARAYLYTKKYTEAEEMSSIVINNSTLFSIVDIDKVFEMNNKEAIWQLQPVGTIADLSANSKEGALFKLSVLPTPSSYLVKMSAQFAAKFDMRDMRRSKWIDSIETDGLVYYFPTKYRIGQEPVATKEYSTVLRLAEQYLIRAEARVMLGKIQEGIEDLNTIRRRATDYSKPQAEQLPELPLNLDQNDALGAIEDERKSELFTEWGHRWFDLKRTKRIDDVMSELKSTWQITDALYPIPEGDLLGNPNLIGHQNPGY
ncbi:RagB/SusD family nutrient uptake outer membrane protein [Chitinophaga sp. S165]|uniref:RagB/SusD family nutrient uptake outer membrane protein n=1 Tax=Chitinophaga sp. S165 TaxID=2135462 RepID=UPI000D71369B|nr:RagB/SusD family nutrient uptake outer membrane protein [Chitinophaga sp. S165]PWV45800.1 SusD-like starch-binding protein associating with outer membrane [Chitinophaga sp. S165]